MKRIIAALALIASLTVGASAATPSANGCPWADCTGLLSANIGNMPMSGLSTPTTAWTPVLLFGGGNTGMTYATQSGQYWVISSTLIRACFNVTLTAPGSSTGSATITGLPFAMSAGAYGGATFTIQTSNNLAAGDIGYLAPGSSALGLYTSTVGGSALTQANFSINTSLIMCGEYNVY